MDTSLEDIYLERPYLRPKDTDNEALRNMKSELIFVLQMTPEEKREWQREQDKQDRVQRLESLQDEYEVNQSIRESTMRWAKHCYLIGKDHETGGSIEEAKRYYGYVRTCKELVETLKEDDRRIRREIKGVVKR